MGLPASYTIILMIRLLPDSPTEAFDIWQVSNKDHKPETGVTVDRKQFPSLVRNRVTGRGAAVLRSVLSHPPTQLALVKPQLVSPPVTETAAL